MKADMPLSKKKKKKCYIGDTNYFLVNNFYIKLTPQNTILVSTDVTPQDCNIKSGKGIMTFKESFDKISIKTIRRSNNDSRDPCKLATIVEGDPKAPFSIATTPRCRGGRYSIILTLMKNISYKLNVVPWVQSMHRHPNTGMNLKKHTYHEIVFFTLDIKHDKVYL